jgi:hypothetical protein
MGISLSFHVLQISDGKLLKFYELLFINNFDDQNFIVRFRKGGVTLASRAVPILAAIETPYIKRNVDTLAKSQFLKLSMVVY